MCVSFEGIHLIIMGLGGVLFTNGLDQTLSMHSSNFLFAVLEGGVTIVWPLRGSASVGWWGVVMCREEKGHLAWDILMGIGCCCYCFFSEWDVTALIWSEQGSTAKMLIAPWLSFIWLQNIVLTPISRALAGFQKWGWVSEVRQNWRVNVRIEMW